MVPPLIRSLQFPTIVNVRLDSPELTVPPLCELAPTDVFACECFPSSPFGPLSHHSPTAHLVYGTHLYSNGGQCYEVEGMPSVCDCTTAVDLSDNSQYGKHGPGPPTVLGPLSP